MRIESFNVIWWGLLACIAVGALLLWLLVGRCSERVRRRVLITISGVNFILFWVYKYWLSQDVSYMQMYGIKGFELWFELPLQLCNINIWLIPLALALKRRSLLAFCFFTGLLGPFMAIVSPAEGFTGDVLMLRNLGFYVTHGLLLIVSISLLTLGFFRPRARDAIWAILLTAALTAAIHGANTLIRLGAHVPANYFYTYGPNGTAVLSVFWKLLPIPLVYLYLLIVPVFPALLLLTGALNLPGWIRSRRQSTRNKKGQKG